jgi:hypothetical protein
MAFNSSISSNQLYAILTPEGKKALANGKFNIKYASFIDSIIDYNLADSSNGDANILSIPVPEPSAEMANLANASFLITVNEGAYISDAILSLAGGLGESDVGTYANPITLDYDIANALVLETVEFVFVNGTPNVAPNIICSPHSEIKAMKISNDTYKFKSAVNPDMSHDGKILNIRVTDLSTMATMTLYFMVRITRS